MRNFDPRWFRMVLCSLVAFCFLVAQPIRAEDRQPTSAEIKKTITEILGKPEFKTQEMQKKLHYMGKKNERDQSSDSWVQGLAEFIGYLASFLEFILWLCVFIIIVLVIVYRDRWLRLFPSASASLFSKSTVPNVLFGLDVRQESLPADIPGEARFLWSRGKTTEAMSLLYRGALARLIIRHGVAISGSATEGECLQRVSQTAHTELAQYFGMLTHAWQITVYAHRLPEDGAVRELCEGFNHHFEKTAS